MSENNNDQVEPGSASVTPDRPQVQLWLNDPERAVERLRLVVADSPADPRAHLALAEEYVNRGDYYVERGLDPRASLRGAIAECDEAIRLGHDSARVCAVRAPAHERLGDEDAARGIDGRGSWERAVSDCDEALTSGGWIPWISVSRALLMERLGRPGALEALLDAPEGPRDAEVRKAITRARRAARAGKAKA